jgi:hypothetical protein
MKAFVWRGRSPRFARFAIGAIALVCSGSSFCRSKIAGFCC